MAQLRVWAPNAQKVEAVVAAQRLAMVPAEEGWWQVESSLAQPPADYAFSIDGGAARPDPRSLWQPNGVHAASRLVNHAAFAWSDANWQAPPLASAILYELHVGTFTPEGTFDAAAGKLDHLRSLGVTHIELMPVNEFAGSRGWGYDGAQIFAPHHAYGGPEGLKRFIDACHARRLAVILDVVYNHFGPEGVYLAEFGPYFTDRYKTPWGQAVNLDGPGSDEVREFLVDNAMMWLRDYHADALRIDGVHALLDGSATHFLEELSQRRDELQAALGRHMGLIGESDLNDPRVIRPSELGGYGLDAQWSDDFHHALHTILTGERDGYYADFGSYGDLAKALCHAFVYDGRHSACRGRRHGRSTAGLAGGQFLAYMQNHDQIGNRAAGERIGMLVSEGKVKIGSALVFTSPFIPMVFQGEEWNADTPFLYFTDYQSEELGRDVREGRRREFAAFGWGSASVPDPQSPQTFERSKLDWAQVAAEPHARMLQWYRRLIELRKSTPALLDGCLERVRTSFDEPRQWFAMQRGHISVMCNLSANWQRVPLPVGASQRVLLASDEGVAPAGAEIELPPESVAILG